MNKHIYSSTVFNYYCSINNTHTAVGKFPHLKCQRLTFLKEMLSILTQAKSTLKRGPPHKCCEQIPEEGSAPV